MGGLTQLRVTSIRHRDNKKIVKLTYVNAGGQDGDSYSAMTHQFNDPHDSAKSRTLIFIYKSDGTQQGMGNRISVLRCNDGLHDSLSYDLPIELQSELELANEEDIVRFLRSIYSLYSLNNLIDAKSA